MNRLRASTGTSQKLQDEIDELIMERDGLVKKANTVERYKQKLQAAQGLEKQNEELLAELSEVRQQFNIADEARQKIAGLQLELEEYKRILPKIEQDRHELQMMKKQLEFDNLALAQRCELANDQHANDQKSLVSLTGKLADVENQGSAINREGLYSELERGARTDEQLQVVTPLLTWIRLTSLSRKARVRKLESENQQLQTAKVVQASEMEALHQLLEDTKARYERRELESLQMYQEKLALESSIAAIKENGSSPGYAIPSSCDREGAQGFSSIDAITQMRDQINAEKQKSAQLEAEVSRLKSQLDGTESDCSSSAGSLNKTDKETDQRNPPNSNAALAEIMLKLKNATAGTDGQGQARGNPALENHVSSLADKIMASRERLAKRTEVQDSISPDDKDGRKAKRQSTRNVATPSPTRSQLERELVTRVSSFELFRAIPSCRSLRH